MRKVIFIPVIILTLLAGGLFYKGPDYAKLTLERRDGGIVVNPVYSITINGKGDVAYDGIRAMVVGEKEAKVKAKPSRKLIVDFLKLNPRLKDKYVSPTDNHTQPISLTFEFLFYKKTIDFDEITAPPKLVEIADNIDKVSNSDKWVFPANM